MSISLKRAVVVVGLLTIGMGLPAPSAGAAEPQTTRAATKKVMPDYPPLARAAGLVGKVKLSLAVTMEGKVKRVDIIGGHPVLVVAAIAAAKQWEFVAANKESSEFLVFEFIPPSSK
jgi:TonB family protein